MRPGFRALIASLTPHGLLEERPGSPWPAGRAQGCRRAEVPGCDATWRPVAGRTIAGLPTRRGLEDMAALCMCLASALPSYAAPHPTAVCAPLLCTRSEHVPISDVFRQYAQWYPKTAQTRSEHVPNTFRTRLGVLLLLEMECGGGGAPDAPPKAHGVPVDDNGCTCLGVCTV